MGGIVKSVFGGGGSQSTSVQNQTTVTVNPTIESSVEIHVDDSRLQKMVDAIVANGAAETEATQQHTAIAAVQAAAALKTAEVAERQTQITENNIMKAAMLGAVATVAAALISR